MIIVKASNKIRKQLNNKIIDFYINIWYERLINLTKRKYSYRQAWNNIYSTLCFFNETFDDAQVKKTTLSSWKNNGWHEIRYNNWHFAIIVQFDMFGNNIAIVQDCIHNKDYHNDTMQTQPFVMDKPDDKSHLVDWREYRLNKLISEAIRDSIRRIL